MSFFEKEIKRRILRDELVEHLLSFAYKRLVLESRDLENIVRNYDLLSKENFIPKGLTKETAEFILNAYRIAIHAKGLEIEKKAWEKWFKR